MPEKQDEIGGLWERTSGKGTKFWSGKINGQDVVIFENRYASENPKAPTHRVYKSKPREE